MNVVISAGGRFHALHLAQQLAKRDCLRRLFTFDYTHADTNIVPHIHVHVVRPCQILNNMFLALHGGRFINKARFNAFKDDLFDNMVAKQLPSLDSCDIFVGWANYALRSIPAARTLGAKIIIESGSCHIATQQQILSDEYARWSIKHSPIASSTLEKMQTEYAAADYIMTLSSFARKSFIKQGLPENKILKIPCGIDVNYFLSQPMMHDKFRVIFVGLVTLRKGIHHLIQAWNKLNLPEQAAELIIVGAQQKDFLSIAPQLPITRNIHFIGSVDRPMLRSLFRQSSAFVLPSIEDGFGMVIGEAMASGLPVICSTSSAGQDIIEHGKHGFLFKSGNNADLAEKIAWCFEHRYEAAEMGNHAQQHIKTFSWELYGEKIFTTYQNIMSRP